MIGRSLRFVADLRRRQLDTWVAGRLRSDPMARLRLRAGRADPYPIYEQLRAAGALTPTRLGGWVSPDHAVVKQILRDRRFGVRPVDEPPPDPLDAPHRDPTRLDLSFLDRNPPDHTRLRALAKPAFTPGRIAGYRTSIEQIADRLLHTARAKGRFDLMSDFAAPLPIAVITELLGVPGADVPRFTHHGAAVGAALDGIRSVRHARALLAADRYLRRMFQDLIALRRREPGEDAISALVGSLGDRLQVHELLAMCYLLLIAGFETTVNLIGNGTLAFLRHPEQWAALRADPGLAEKAVEEILRYDPPVQRTTRFALQDVPVAGRTVVRDGWVTVLLGAANRDPAVFACPDRFDIARGTAEHLAFSAGIHYCLGAPLARLEGAIAFRALAAAVPGLRPAGRPTRRGSITIRGLASLPVQAG